jgi:hypothetical protein
MQISIDGLEVRERHGLPQNHLVETGHKVRVEEASVEDRKTQAPPDELEVAQVVRVDPGRRVNLQRVVVVRRVFEQTVAWVEDLVRQKEEPFSADWLIQRPGPRQEPTTHLPTPP